MNKGEKLETEEGAEAFENFFGSMAGSSTRKLAFGIATTLLGETESFDCFASFSESLRKLYFSYWFTFLECFNLQLQRQSFRK